MSTIFISYTSAQTRLASLLARELQANNHVVIKYPFPPQVDFVEAIANGLVQADTVIALVSQSYLTSNWCVKEFALAHKMGKLVPILVERCDTGSLPVSVNFHKALKRSNEQNVETILKAYQGFRSRPKNMPFQQVFSFVENVRIFIPLFGKGEFAKQLQSSMFSFAQTLFAQENVQIEVWKEAISSRGQAEKLRVKQNADIVLYGLFQNSKIHVGFCSRGWRYETGLPRLELIESSVIQIPFHDVSKLQLVFHTAYAHFESGRARKIQALSHFSIALQSLSLDEARAVKAHYLYALYGQTLSDYSMWVESERMFRIARDLSPESSDGWRGLGFVLIKQGRFQEAIECLNYAIQQSPRNEQSAGLWNNLSYAYDAISQWNKAMQCIDIAIGHSPNNPGFHDMKGHLLVKSGDLNGAIVEFGKAIWLEPESPAYWNNRAVVYTMLEKADLALSDYQQLCVLDSASWKGWSGAAGANYLLGNYCEAYKCMSKAIQLGSQTSTDTSETLTYLLRLCHGR